MKRPTRRLPIEAWMLIKDPDDLKKARRKRGYTQVELAGLCRVTQQYISAMERGSDKDISDNVAYRICKWLDVDVDYLFEEKKVIRTSRVATPSRASGNVAA